MLWPPPKRHELVALTCGCCARVVFRVPLAFVYYLRLEPDAPACGEAGHVTGRHFFVALEAIATRAASKSPNDAPSV